MLTEGAVKIDKPDIATWMHRHSVAVGYFVMLQLSSVMYFS